jgi:4-hydroxy-2-oxoheptanedioate aldolase
MSPFVRNKLASKLDEGKIAIIANGLNNPEICDFLGQLDFDACFIDMEHGNIDWKDIPNITRACELWGMSTVLRVNKIEESLILRALDLGAGSIMVPHVRTANDAIKASKACRYPPQGTRGVAGNRRSYGVNDYYNKANSDVRLIGLIEDKEAIDNLDEILEVEGLDILYVAPSDLAASLGFIGQNDHPEVKKIIFNTLKKIILKGKTAGTLANDENLNEYIEMGVKCIGIPWQLWVVKSANNLKGKINKFYMNN